MLGDLGLGTGERPACGAAGLRPGPEEFINRYVGMLGRGRCLARTIPEKNRKIP